MRGGRDPAAQRHLGDARAPPQHGAELGPQRHGDAVRDNATRAVLPPPCAGDSAAARGAEESSWFAADISSLGTAAHLLHTKTRTGPAGAATMGPNLLCSGVVVAAVMPGISVLMFSDYRRAAPRRPPETTAPRPVRGARSSGYARGPGGRFARNGSPSETRTPATAASGQICCARRCSSAPISSGVERGRRRSS